MSNSGFSSKADDQTCGFGRRGKQPSVEFDEPKYRIKRTKRPDTDAHHCKKQDDGNYKCYYPYSSRFGKQYCKGGKKPVPVNKKLYNSIKNRIKRTLKAKRKKWPGRWASYQVVNKYKKRGGKYRCGFGSIVPQQTCGFGLNPPNEWQAVGNVSEFHRLNIMDAIGLVEGDLVHIKGTPPNKRYIINEIRVYGPRCETMIWCVDSEAPPGNREDKYTKNVSIAEITNSVCDPDGINYKPKPRAGVRVQGFGKSLESFYRKGSSNHTNLTPGIRNCQTRVYGPQILQARTMFGVDDCNGKEKSECVANRACVYSARARKRSERCHSRNYQVVNGYLARAPGDYRPPPPPPPARMPGYRLGGFGKTDVLTREINYLNKL
jgi:hypothetical protein